MFSTPYVPPQYAGRGVNGEKRNKGHENDCSVQYHPHKSTAIRLLIFLFIIKGNKAF
jgi:hypothetical protein